ncbi:hypothetical protein EGW08_018837, partial [Elysia chlorotica]
MIEQMLIGRDDGLRVQQMKLHEQRVHVAVVLLLGVAAPDHLLVHGARPRRLAHVTYQTLRPHVPAEVKKVAQSDVGLWIFDHIRVHQSVQLE